MAFLAGVACTGLWNSGKKLQYLVEFNLLSLPAVLLDKSNKRVELPAPKLKCVVIFRKKDKTIKKIYKKIGLRGRWC
ncbi:MAG: hypothetical protein ACTSUE_26655 [Promethearchaeota archaeon]